MNEIKLGAEILALRTERGMTQDEVAEKLGVSDKSVSKWETQTAVPDVETVVKLADLFGVTVDRLLGLNASAPPSFGNAVRAEFAAHPENPADALFGMHEELLAESRMVLYDYGQWEKKWVPLTRHPNYPRRFVSCRSGYQLTVNSPDVNLSLALFRNERDFAWLKEAEKREGMARVFALLADPDAIRVLGLFFEAGCPAYFTADTVAAKAGIDVPHAERILAAMKEIGLAVAETAHLPEGETAIWRGWAQEWTLFLLSLTYEMMYGRNANDIGYGGDGILIGGEEK